MFKKILIANRGEIACRIARTCHRISISTVGVYSEQDKHSRHAAFMDQSFVVGPAASSESYLKIPHIIEIADYSKVDAVHPGYGFLSENVAFVRELEKKNIKFIGPPAEAMEKMASKSQAKKIMDAAGVPILKGYHGDNQDPNFLLAEAKKIGFPVMLKAALGGGGKGMRIVRNEGEFMDQLDAAKREAMKGFADDSMIIEKYVERPRHIEMQVFGDSHGNYLHLNERDCTMQRRHQKIIEEAPSIISPQLRETMGEAAIAAAKAVGYQNAGTVEFIYDNDTDDFYFMEMNTRLQVEHPITEMITDQDLVEWQIRVASGQHLPIISQKYVPLRGHSIEARIYAEDPANGFLPQSGTISVLREPPTGKDVRIDSGVCEGDEISTYYDPMIAKLIVHGDTREQAIDKMKASLNEYKIAGIPTNVAFLKRLMNLDEFKDGHFDTSVIEQNIEMLIQPSRKLSLTRLGSVAIVQVFLETLQRRLKRKHELDPWHQNDMFRLNHIPFRDVTLLNADTGEEIKMRVQYVHENVFNSFIIDKDGFLTSCNLNVEVEMNPERKDDLLIRTDQENFKVDFYLDNHGNITQLDYDGNPINIYIKPNKLITEEDVAAASAEPGASFVVSPMPGRIVKCFVQSGENVTKGQTLVSVESMKMEYFVKASQDGVVDQVLAGEGDAVQLKQKLVTLSAPQA